MYQALVGEGRYLSLGQIAELTDRQIVEIYAELGKDKKDVEPDEPETPEEIELALRACMKAAGASDAQIDAEVRRQLGDEPTTH